MRAESREFTPGRDRYEKCSARLAMMRIALLSLVFLASCDGDGTGLCLNMDDPCCHGCPEGRFCQDHGCWPVCLRDGCPAGQYCSQWDGCLALPGRYESCRLSDACAEGLLCRESFCTVPCDALAPGEACDAQTVCLQAEPWRPEAGEKYCAQTCWSSNAQPCYQRCQATDASGGVAVCRDPIAEGEGCGSDADCDQRFVCSPDPTTIGAGTCEPDTVPPSVPTGVTATPEPPEYIDITWTAAVDNRVVEGYIIYRDGEPMGAGYISQTIVTDGGATHGVQHCYTVVAGDLAGNHSEPSAPACATLP